MYKKQNYKIYKDSNGARYVKMENGNVIQAGIAALCAGKGKWLSEIKCKCRECKKEFMLSELNDDGQFCEECQLADL